MKSRSKFNFRLNENPEVAIIIILIESGSSVIIGPANHFLDKQEEEDKMDKEKKDKENAAEKVFPSLYSISSAARMHPFGKKLRLAYITLSYPRWRDDFVDERDVNRTSATWITSFIVRIFVTSNSNRKPLISQSGRNIDIRGAAELS